MIDDSDNWKIYVLTIIFEKIFKIKSLFNSNSYDINFKKHNSY